MWEGADDPVDHRLAPTEVERRRESRGRFRRNLACSVNPSRSELNGLTFPTARSAQRSNIKK